MKFRIFIAAAMFFCFFGCETIQDKEIKPDVPVVEQQDETESITTAPIDDLQTRQAELDKLEEELNAEWASLRLRKDAIEQQQAELDSLFTIIEQREKIADMEIARATQLRATGGWMLFIGVVLIVLALYMTFRPKNKKQAKSTPSDEPKTATHLTDKIEPTNPQPNAPKEEEPAKADPESSETEPEDEKDELYEQAKHLVLDNQKAAISFLQSELKIGRARVMKLLEEMEKEGIVGPAESGKSRQVLK